MARKSGLAGLAGITALSLLLVATCKNSPTSDPGDDQTQTQPFAELNDSLAAVELAKTICSAAFSCSQTAATDEEQHPDIELHFRNTGNSLGFSPFACRHLLMEHIYYDTTKTRQDLDRWYAAITEQGTECIQADSAEQASGSARVYTLLPAECLDIMDCNSGPCLN